MRRKGEGGKKRGFSLPNQGKTLHSVKSKRKFLNRGIASVKRGPGEPKTTIYLMGESSGRIYYNRGIAS